MVSDVEFYQLLYMLGAVTMKTSDFIPLRLPHPDGVKQHLPQFLPPLLQPTQYSEDIWGGEGGVSWWGDKRVPQ